jgi:Flp pilus assembly protein CpaB
VQRIPVREVEVKSYYVAVAARALPMGTMVSANDVKLVAWPVSSPVTGGYSKLEEVTNRGLISSVSENEPLTSTKLAAPEAGAGLALVIRAGAGIVVYSDAELDLAESRAKARGLVGALGRDAE